MGSELSAVQVRSCTLDTWLPEQVSFMAATGNAAANGYWEAKLASNQKPHYESSDLEPFIRRKYCNKEYAEGTWPPVAAVAANCDQVSPQPVVKTAQNDRSAGRSEAGGFWGSLTPQESGTGRDWGSQGGPTSSDNSPALLIDLMDFGADSTFQLPTTPRRGTSSPAQQAFDSPADIHARSPGPSTLGTHNSRQSVHSAAAAAVPAVARQQSSFPALPPPPQVRHA